MVKGAMSHLLNDIHVAFEQYQEGLITGEELSNKIAYEGLALLEKLPVDHNPLDAEINPHFRHIAEINGEDLRFLGCCFGRDCRYLDNTKVPPLETPNLSIAVISDGIAEAESLVMKARSACIKNSTVHSFLCKVSGHLEKQQKDILDNLLN